MYSSNVVISNSDLLKVELRRWPGAHGGMEKELSFYRRQGLFPAAGLRDPRRRVQLTSTNHLPLLTVPAPAPSQPSPRRRRALTRRSAVQRFRRRSTPPTSLLREPTPQRRLSATLCTGRTEYGSTRSRCPQQCIPLLSPVGAVIAALPVRYLCANWSTLSGGIRCPAPPEIVYIIKLLFQTGFDEAELRSYTSVIHANVYQTVKEDVLHARVRTNGVVETQFSPLGENKRGGEVYRLYDVGGQRNERRKWIHLFEGVDAVIFCAAISEYDQMLFEDETKNRMMETKELFDWVLKQRCFEKTSFMLFLNKFDIFERKIQKVPLSVCEWFKDYQPTAPGKQEVEHAYEFVKKKFEEVYFQSSKPDRVDRVFKIYRTTALDQKLVKKTFKLIDESMRRSREGT
ncbi:hypothetical protein PR202_gb18757 [Eleusine coracana subsp. coracana]|uniref:Uncharacterized protein n=1 Tax=Eleusine coracana subsp. coracana TaxID=191504 RepID=A0AAV5F461_ELECO|nr:hypothetical protein PR202_gb18757 [Eleusine coracana subsp. coracana]